MRVSYFGHAAVGLETSAGTRLLVDPYESGGLRGGIEYDPIRWEADFVVCTHGHADHSAVDALPVPRPERVERGVHGPFRIRRFRYVHDEYDGERFGDRVDVLRIDIEGRSVVHLSDVGESPGGAVPSELRRPDVAFVPTGGLYTIGACQAWEWIGQLSPRAVVPVHFSTRATDLGLHPLDVFVAHTDRFDRVGRSLLEIPEDLPAEPRTGVGLEPRCLPSP